MGGKMEKNEKKKIKMFLVATNVVASRPPERRPTATPTARAKIHFFFKLNSGNLAIAVDIHQDSPKKI